MLEANAVKVAAFPPFCPDAQASRSRRFDEQFLIFRTLSRRRTADEGELVLSLLVLQNGVVNMRNALRGIGHIAQQR
jgi:hypothetical protein